jgi:hypothetical protein
MIVINAAVSASIVRSNRKERGEADRIDCGIKHNKKVYVFRVIPSDAAVNSARETARIHAHKNASAP